MPFSLHRDRTVKWSLRQSQFPYTSDDPVTNFAIKGIIRVTDDIDPRYETGWL
jgi:hypothetical protein